MATRGSAKLVREKGIPKKELDRLWKMLDEDDSATLVHWLERGQPAVDSLVGVVKVKFDSAGVFVGKLLGHKGLMLKLKMFPLGIVDPQVVLIEFERGGPSA